MAVNSPGTCWTVAEEVGSQPAVPATGDTTRVPPRESRSESCLTSPGRLENRVECAAALPRGCGWQSSVSCW